MSMLKVEDLHVYYGSIHAIKGISFEVNEGEVVTLIGANGAGKSTTLNTVSGLLKPRSGSVTFEDKSIVGVPAHKIVSHGMALCPEGRRVFLQMTVQENLEMGGYTRPAGEIDAAIQAGASEGMISMDEYIVRLAKAGQITKETALQHAINAEQMQRKLR